MTDPDLYRYNAWRKRIQHRLPEWAERTFALRGKMYDGYGGHWSLEKDLGRTIYIANDYENLADLATQLVNYVKVELFCESLKEAELSAKMWSGR